MAILADRLMRHEPLQNGIVVRKESAFVVVDIDARADMHRVNETQTLLDSAFLQCAFHLGSDVDVRAPGPGFERQFFTIGLHMILLS